MDILIRKIEKRDKSEVAGMMKVFYASDAVSTNGSAEIFENSIEACLAGSPYLKGFVIEKNETLVGYLMMAYSFSTEFGKPCVWLEDIYIKPEYHNMGIGHQAMKYFADTNPNAILRLEVDENNERAIHVYEKQGFRKLSYVEMKHN